MLRSLALSWFAFGCAVTPESRCEDAARAVEQCTGQVPDGFMEACAADDEIASEIAATSCSGSGEGKADGLDRFAFTAACKVAVLASFVLTRERSPTAIALSRADRDLLRPEFGDLVDRVRVSWNARLPGQWKLFGHVYELGDYGAQTYGETIFFAQDITSDRERTLVHELQHARQAQDRGGLGGFAWDYCQAFYQAEFSYENNALEKDANLVEDRICAGLGEACR